MALPMYGYVRLTSGYQLPQRPSHNGYDLVSYAPSAPVPTNTIVRAIIDGVVGQSTIVTNKNDRTWEWGNYVRIDSNKKDYYVFSCHLASRSVKVGDKVKVGDPIGIMGNTGYSQGAHVHLEVRKFGTTQAVNPIVIAKEMPNVPGTVIQYNPQQEDDDSMYRLYKVDYASEDKKAAQKNFSDRLAKGERVGFDRGGSDGKYRVGPAIMAVQDPSQLFGQLDYNYFIG